MKFNFKYTDKNMKKLFLIVVICLLFYKLYSSRDIIFRNELAIFLYKNLISVYDTTEFPTCHEILSKSINNVISELLLMKFNSNETTILLGKYNWFRGNCEEATRNWLEVYNQVIDKNSVGWWLYWALDYKENKVSYIQLDKIYSYIKTQADSLDLLGYSSNAKQWYLLDFSLNPDRIVAGKLSYSFTNDVKERARIWQYLISETDTTMEDYWWAKGELAAIEGNFTLAAAAYENGAKLSNDPYDFVMRAGNSYLALDDSTNAWDAYQEGLRLKPYLAGPYLSLGEVKMQIGDFASALSWYSEAHEKSKSSPDPYYAMGRLYYIQSNWYEAAFNFQQALSFRANFPEALFYLANSLYQMDDKLEAIQKLSNAVQLDLLDHPSEWIILLGDWELEIGNKQEAINAYSQALEWEPNNQAIQDKLDALK